MKKYLAEAQLNTFGVRATLTTRVYKHLTPPLAPQLAVQIAPHLAVHIAPHHPPHLTLHSPPHLAVGAVGAPPSHRLHLQRRRSRPSQA